MSEAVFQEICNDFLPVFRRFSGTEECSITLGGSRGKQCADERSDYDFALYYEKPVGREERRQLYQEIAQLTDKWKQRGVIVDDIWPRTYAEVETQLEAWIMGKGTSEPYVWTIWGYNILPNLYQDIILEDTKGRVAQWKEKLSTYPHILKQAVLDKHGTSLRYWRNDYHYRNKVYRKDEVFLASLTARLIHDMIQVLYALNECYYPGDGMNLQYIARFRYKPQRFEERVIELLHVGYTEDAYEAQYKKMMELIDEVLKLMA